MGMSCDLLSTRLNRATSGHEIPTVKSSGKAFMATASQISGNSYDNKGNLKYSV